jgi:hypothetical protein
LSGGALLKLIGCDTVAIFQEGHAFEARNIQELTSGVDAVAGRQEAIGVRYADDMVTMPLQCGTQWDALGHIFFGEKMWNGYDARLVDSGGAHKNGIEKTKDKMVGRASTVLVI